MSWTISLSGDGAKSDAVRRIFEKTVRDLRAVTPSDGKPVDGRAGGGDHEGRGFVSNARDVPDREEDV